MQETLIEQLYTTIINEVNTSADMSVAFDHDLSYIAANDHACSYLGFKREELIGKSPLDLFPEITASKNHRNLLRARSGIHLQDQEIVNRQGDKWVTSYKPVIHEGEVMAIVVIGKKQEK